MTTTPHIWTTAEIESVLGYYESKVTAQTDRYFEATREMQEAMKIIDFGVVTDSGRIEGIEALEDAILKAKKAARMVSWHEAQLETAKTLIATETN